MAVKDSKIKSVLRRIVRDRLAKKQEVTNKQVRVQAERELKLDAGFLNEGDWKKKYKDIILETFEEEAEEDEEAVAPAPAKSRSPPKPQKDVPESSKTREKKTAEANGRSTTTSTVAQKSKALPNGGVKEDKEDSQDSDESEDSDSSDESETSKTKDTNLPALQKPEHSPPKVNGVKRKASEDNSSKESSEHDSDSEKASEAPPKKKAKSVSYGGKETAPPSSQPAGSQSHSSLIPAQPYRPPPGFSAMRLPSSTSNDSLLSRNLEGKQIWHIVAPSNIDPASLSNLSLNMLSSSNPEITINEVKYTLDREAIATSTPATVMISTPEGYTSVPHKVERSLTLKQKIELPNLNARQASQNAGSSAAADVARTSVSTVRLQPKGLRMRYRPPGFGVGKLGAVGSGSESEGEEDEEGESSLQFPKAMGGHGTKKRSIADHDVTMVDADVEETQKSSKKKEKKQKEKYSRESQSQGDGVVVRNDSLTTPSKARHLASYSPERSDLRPTKFVTNGVHDEADAGEERARRKEEKRAKKEAKRKAKEASQT